jgi:hypothetical protein
MNMLDNQESRFISKAKMVYGNQSQASTWLNYHGPLQRGHDLLKSEVKYESAY